MFEKIKDFFITLREKFKIENYEDFCLGCDFSNTEVLASAVVANVLDRGIDWFDHTKLSREKRLKYFTDAQAALRNETLQNEAKHIIADLVEHIAKQTRDFREVENLRMTINGIQLLKERLESIPDPNKEESRDDLYNAI